jgi:hypothetical protein
MAILQIPSRLNAIAPTPLAELAFGPCLPLRFLSFGVIIETISIFQKENLLSNKSFVSVMTRTGGSMRY